MRTHWTLSVSEYAVRSLRPFCRGARRVRLCDLHAELNRDIIGIEESCGKATSHVQSLCLDCQVVRTKIHN